MTDLLKSIMEHEDTPPVLAALAGALLRFCMKSGTTPRQAMISVLAAVSAAYWGAPWLADLFSLGPHALAPIGWVSGIVAADLARGMLRLGEIWSRQPWRFIGKGGGKDD